MANHGKVHIYALQDPRDGTVRYVGQARDLNKRLSDHIREAHTRRPPVDCKSEWILSLSESGLTPNMQLLETVDGIDRLVAEAKWISHFTEIGAIFNDHRRCGAIVRFGWQCEPPAIAVFCGRQRRAFAWPKTSKGRTATLAAIHAWISERNGKNGSLKALKFIRSEMPIDQRCWDEGFRLPPRSEPYTGRMFFPLARLSGPNPGVLLRR